MKLRSLALAGLGLALVCAAPAFADDCRSSGKGQGKAIAFPSNSPKDEEFAKSAQVAISPETYNRLPSAIPCWRLTFPSDQGEYEMGGENPAPFARIATPKGGTKGPIVYLFKVDGAALGQKEVYALATYQRGIQSVIKRFYDAIPSDEYIAGDIQVALRDTKGLITYDIASKQVTNTFAAAAPVGADPQVAIAGKPDEFLDENMRHKGSGFTCPPTFRGLPVMLNIVNPKASGLQCRYRGGTSLEHDAKAPVRYQIEIDNAPGVTAKEIFDTLAPTAKLSFKVTGDRAPPMLAGAPPGPEQVGYWTTEGGQTLGIFINVTKGWLVRVRTLFPTSELNDAEAGSVVKTLFDSAAAQIKPATP